MTGGAASRVLALGGYPPEDHTRPDLVTRRSSSARKGLEPTCRFNCDDCMIDCGVFLDFFQSEMIVFVWLLPVPFPLPFVVVVFLLHLLGQVRSPPPRSTTGGDCFSHLADGSDPPYPVIETREGGSRRIATGDAGDIDAIHLSRLGARVLSD